MKEENKNTLFVNVGLVVCLLISYIWFSFVHESVLIIKNGYIVSDCILLGLFLWMFLLVFRIVFIIIKKEIEIKNKTK